MLLAQWARFKQAECNKFLFAEGTICNTAFPHALFLEIGGKESLVFLGPVLYTLLRGQRSSIRPTLPHSH